MSYLRQIWQDHVTEYINRVTVTENADGSVTYEPVEGEIVQAGTPMNARNFNNMEEGILAAGILGAELARSLLHYTPTGGSTYEEEGTVTLNNYMEYPFNNSARAVTLETPRGTGNYEVIANIVSSSDIDRVGRIVITDKEPDRFHIAYTGSAQSAVISYGIRGV